MPKSIVFISHITDESEIAIEFKTLIEKEFLGLIDVFVSSDGRSIQMGQKWLNDISIALENCAVEIVICSPVSVHRPWINFEAGAGWVRKIPVIPLCHSGMEPSKLPVPLNLLQAAKATDISALNLVFPVIANAIGANPPITDFTGFIQKITEFESSYTFWDKCNRAFEILEQVKIGATQKLKNAKINIDFKLTENQRDQLKPHMDFLCERKIITFQQFGVAEYTNSGVYYNFKICRLPKLAQIFTRSSFKTS